MESSAEKKRMLTTEDAGRTSQEERQSISETHQGTSDTEVTSQGSGEGEQGTPSYEYRNPMLKGRSPEEVERLFEMQQEAARETGARLSVVERELASNRQPRQEPPKEISASEFYDNPGAALTRALQEAVAPLREEIREARSFVVGRTARDDLRREFSDWDQIEPMIDNMLRVTNYPDPEDPGLLRTLYFTSKGMLAHQGVSTSAPNREPQEERGERRVDMAPPQHRASTPPPPPPPPGRGRSAPHRELTENEKRLAREAGMTAEQYLHWQEMEPEEVPLADFDLQKKEGGSS